VNIQFTPASQNKMKIEHRKSNLMASDSGQYPIDSDPVIWQQNKIRQEVHPPQRVTKSLSTASLYRCNGSGLT